MSLAAFLLLATVASGDESMESRLKGLRSDDPVVRAGSTAGILDSWSLWNAADLAMLEEAARDPDPEVGARAKEARARIQIRRTVGKNLFHRIDRVDDAFVHGDDQSKLAALAEAKRMWSAGKLTQDDLTGLELLVARTQWNDPTSLDRFLKDPEAKGMLPMAGNAESRVRLRVKEVELLGIEGNKRSTQVAEYLADGAPEVRAMALQVIGGIEARDHAPKVGELLRDQHAGVRSEALALLGAWGAKEYAPEFARLLGDSNGRVRLRAVEMLGVWGQRTAGPGIAKLLEDPFAPSRAEAAMVLGSFGAREFAPKLKPLLADSKAIVRRSAAYALGRFGALEFAPQLKTLLKDPDPEVRLTAAQALGQLDSTVQGHEVVTLLRDADPEVQAEAAWVLGFTASKDAVERIALLVKDSDAETRQRSVQALGLSKGREFIAPVAALLPDEAPWVRSEAVLALGRIGTKEDVPRIAVLLRDPDRKVRVGAALALGELGFAEAGEFLGAPAKDPDRLLRLASTLSLARLGKVGVAAFRSALKEVATDDLAFACLGTAALEAAAFIENREAWQLLDRPLPLRRSVETWTDLSEALSDAGLTLEIRANCSIGRLDKSYLLRGRDALAWLLGRFSPPALVLDGRTVRLMDRREGLSFWLTRLEKK